jgi:predicted RNA binding protein YcfA (HicA-like mRNA interferase family)
MTAKQVIGKLKENGWALNRINGSHRVLSKKAAARYRSLFMGIRASETLQRKS